MQARWLRYVSDYPTQFAGERLLNIYKATEVLFGRVVDSMKAQLRTLRVKEEAVELIVGLTYVRDQVDVGHPAIATLSAEQHDGLQRYVLAVEDVVTWLLRHLVRELAAERFRLELDSGASSKKKRAATIATIGKWTESVNHLQPGTFLREGQ